jgi:hypothetical protein
VNNEKDDFWDIGKLIPKKQKTASPFVTRPQVKDFVVSGCSTETQNFNRDISKVLFNSTEKDVKSYEPEGSLIKKVTVISIKDKYDFYGSFRRAALLYYDMKAHKCEFVPFFSYMPQYSQLSPEQRSYYLFWREEIRNSRYIKTDYSYIYLLVYEILNLPDKIPHEKALGLLINLWREYKTAFPNINAQVSVWIQDYCLMYNIPYPFEKISDFIYDAICNSSFKEFYLSDVSYLTEGSVEALIAYLSYYDWRRGKFAGGENKDVYKKHLLGAMRLLIYDLFKKGKLTSDNSKLSKLRRPTFQGSLCTHAVKAMLEIEYYSISNDEVLKATLTESLRYTENQLRALLGVKSRLAVKDMDEECKKIIDFYFSTVFETAAKKRREALRPEYEKLYDSKSEGFSQKNAEEIEKLSWENTLKLVSEEELSEAEREENSNQDEKESGESLLKTSDSYDKNIDNYGLLDYEIRYLEALLNSDDESAGEIVRTSGELRESIIEKINESFLEYFGDIVIDTSLPQGKIIEDYEEEVKEWIEKILK